MRLCRFESNGSTILGLYSEEFVFDLQVAFADIGQSNLSQAIGNQNDLLELLPPDTALWSELLANAKKLNPWQTSQAEKAKQGANVLGVYKHSQVRLLPPVARPNKLLLLAGNYVEHVHEQGDRSAERQHTFPYVFSKPPSTTLLGSGAVFTIPSVSPNKIDYELELAVVIGRRTRHVPAHQALQHVAGYCVINDISDRGYRPNPERHERPRDKFFDWLHGKWHDGSCPCGPCLLTSDEVPDPNRLAMRLKIDGETRQEASTDQQVFSVAETIAFISEWMTLEPGDIISTGTPAGVGNASGRFLQAGQRVEATIDGIGTLVTIIA